MMSPKYDNFPSSWEVVRLGDFVENEKGKKPKHQQETPDDRFCYPYIDIEAFEQKNIKSYADGENCRFCSNEDFLMVWDGSRSGLVGKGVSGALGSTLVRINFPYIVNDYAFYFLQSKYLQINSRAKGSGTPHVDPDLLWNYPFPIPPSNEQYRIVAKIEELFSELDKGIESLRTAREQLKVYRQALLKQAFEGKLTEQWRKENANKLETSEQLLARIQQEREARYQQQLEEWKEAVTRWEAEGKEGKKPTKPKSFESFIIISPDESRDLQTLPQGWMWTKLGNLIDYVTSGSRGWAKYYSETGAKFIRAQNLKYDRLDLDEIAYVKLLKNVEGKRTLIKKGDLLITITGANVTKTAYVKSNLGESYVSQHVALCRLVNNQLDNYLYMFLIAGTSGRKQLEKSAYGAGKPGLNLDNIKNVIVPMTSVDECKMIAELLEKNNSVIGQIDRDLDEQIFKAEALRQSILKKAFSGQLVPQNPNDEPASELLKRIATEKAKLESQAKAAKAAVKKTTTAKKKQVRRKAS